MINLILQKQDLFEVVEAHPKDFGDKLDAFKKDFVEYTKELNVSISAYSEAAMVTFNCKPVFYTFPIQNNTLLDLFKKAQTTSFKINPTVFRRTYDRYITYAEKGNVERIPYQIYRDIKAWKINREQDTENIYIDINKDGTSQFTWFEKNDKSGTINFLKKEHPLQIILFQYSTYFLQHKQDDIKRNWNPNFLETTKDTKFTFTIDTRKENNTMKTPFNFDFGPVTSGIKFSPFGLAIVNKEGNYVVYKDGTITDTMGITFDIKGMAYRMPVALTDIRPNDLIIYNKKPVYVTAIKGNDIEVVDIYEGEKKTVIPATNAFGFNFLTKIVTFINFDGMAPDSNNPFGNILPFLMFADDGKDLFGGDNNDMMKFFMLSAMTGNMTNPFAAFMPTAANKE